MSRLEPDLLTERIRGPLQRRSALRRWACRREQVLAGAAGGYVRRLDDLPFTSAQLRLIAQRRDRDGVSLLADIDQDGFFLSYVGPLPGLSTVDEAGFLSRYYRIQLVAFGDLLAVRKHYRRHWLHFVREVSALTDLGTARCNVPQLLDYDANRLVLVESFILGEVLRETLARHGARIRDRDIDPSVLPRTARDRRRYRAEQVRRVLDGALPAAFLRQLQQQVANVHQAGYVIGDVKYGNIILERDTHQPFLIDFDRSRSHPRLPAPTQRWLQARDDTKLHQLLGAC